jgi:hypothetical protein
MQNFENQTNVCVVNNSHQCFHGLDIEISLPPLSMLLLPGLFFGQLWQRNLAAGRKFSPLLNLTFRSTWQNYLGQALATGLRTSERLPTHSVLQQVILLTTQLSPLASLHNVFLRFQPFIHQQRLKSSMYIHRQEKRAWLRTLIQRVNSCVSLSRQLTKITVSQEESFTEGTENILF